jgi:hypothetical protein
VSKDVTIRGYFSKPEVACEQKHLGNTGLHEPLNDRFGILSFNTWLMKT